MGIEPYLVASTLEAVLAQRLVRRLCPTCRQSYVPTEAERPEDFPAHRSLGFSPRENVGLPDAWAIARTKVY